MNYKSFAEHTIIYVINNISYTTTVNFVTNQIFIEIPNSPLLILPLDLYTDFDGDMESFVKDTISKV